MTQSGERGAGMIASRKRLLAGAVVLLAVAGLWMFNVWLHRVPHLHTPEIARMIAVKDSLDFPGCIRLTGDHSHREEQVMGRFFVTQQYRYADNWDAIERYCQSRIKPEATQATGNFVDTWYSGTYRGYHAQVAMSKHKLTLLLTPPINSSAHGGR